MLFPDPRESDKCPCSRFVKPVWTTRKKITNTRHKTFCSGSCYDTAVRPWAGISDLLVSVLSLLMRWWYNLVCIVSFDSNFI